MGMIAHSQTDTCTGMVSRRLPSTVRMTSQFRLRRGLLRTVGGTLGRRIPTAMGVPRTRRSAIVRRVYGGGQV